MILGFLVEVIVKGELLLLEVGKKKVFVNIIYLNLGGF